MAWFYALEISFLAALQVGAAVVLADLTRDKIQVWKEINEGLIERIEVVHKYDKMLIYCAESSKIGDIASEEPAPAMAGQKLEDARIKQKLEYLHIGEETVDTLKSKEIRGCTHGTESEVFTIRGEAEEPHGAEGIEESLMKPARLIASEADISCNLRPESDK